MHNNYYFFRQLVPAITGLLKGQTLLECFSQNKDELVFRFENRKTLFFIKAVLTSGFTCISFPQQFNRSRKNSADIFPELIGLQVTNLTQYLNERAFAIHFENNFNLVFKMHGNRSNIILLNNDKVISLFKNSLIKDKEITLQLHRHIDQTFDNFINNKEDVAALFPTFGKLAAYYFEEIALKQKPLAEQWHLISELRHQLENPVYYITRINDDIAFSLLNIGEILVTHHDPVMAINDFFYKYNADNHFDKEKKRLLFQLAKKKEQQLSYISKTSQKLFEIETKAAYEHLGNLIMANLHAIPAHTTEVELIDFYTNLPIKIKLKKDLSPQKNAEEYYRKGKNKKIEIDQLKTNISNKNEQLAETERLIDILENVEDLRQLKEFTKTEILNLDETTADKAAIFKEFMKDGFKILIGRNAKNNDELTLKYAWKEDMWLHAKDVSGSHVVIKYQSGKNFPKPVLEYAARLAAYFSKRKNDTVCPVIYTPKKYVRKVKGAAPGSVIVEKESVILVPPLTAQEI